MNRDLKNALLIIVLATVLILGWINLRQPSLDENGKASAETEVTKELLVEVNRNLDIGTLIVWKRDSSVTRVEGMSMDTSRIHHKKLNQPVDAVSPEVVADKAIMVLPRRSSLSDDYGNITRYRRAALVFADPGYDNYFRAPVH